MATIKAILASADTFFALALGTYRAVLPKTGFKVLSGGLGIRIKFK
jgi:hypothetical protein